VDAFDKRAAIHHDMNTPVPAFLHDAFNTILDIGSMEHVFDTKQCIENLFRMLRNGGHILIHTACRGYFDHGLHTFSPECIVGALLDNGFELRYLKYSSTDGYLLQAPVLDDDVLLWAVGRKVKNVSPFVPPQQSRWLKWYRGEAESLDKWYFDLTEGRMDSSLSPPPRDH
jgi:SAM-dependent methyltransferase